MSGGGNQRTRTRHEYWPGQAHLPWDACPDIRDRSYSIVVDIEVADVPPAGVLVAHGDRACGYSLYFADGILIHDYNRAGIHTVTKARVPMGPGTHRVAFRFTRTDQLSGLGSLEIDGVTVAAEPHRETFSLVLSFEGLDIGADELVAVSPDYESPFRFNGTIDRVVYELAEDQGTFVPPIGSAEPSRQ
jgi:hypothetical protein